MGALASHDQQADVAERVATLLQGAELVYGERDGFSPAATAWPKARSSRPRCC
jgi:hypothetical protein